MNQSKQILETLGRIDEEEDIQGLNQVIGILGKAEKDIEAVFKKTKIAEFTMGAIREDLFRIRMQLQHRVDRIVANKPAGDGSLYPIGAGGQVAG